MPHQQAAHCSPLTVDREVAYLPPHLRQGPSVVVHVRSGTGEPQGCVITAVLGVRQIDIDHPIEQSQGLE